MKQILVLIFLFSNFVQMRIAFAESIITPNCSIDAEADPELKKRMTKYLNFVGTYQGDVDFYNSTYNLTGQNIGSLHQLETRFTMDHAQTNELRNLNKNLKDVLDDKVTIDGAPYKLENLEKLNTSIAQFSRARLISEMTTKLKSISREEINQIKNSNSLFKQIQGLKALIKKNCQGQLCNHFDQRTQLPENQYIQIVNNPDDAELPAAVFQSVDSYAKDNEMTVFIFLMRFLNSNANFKLLEGDEYNKVNQLAEVYDDYLKNGIENKSTPDANKGIIFDIEWESQEKVLEGIYELKNICLLNDSLDTACLEDFKKKNPEFDKNYQKLLLAMEALTANKNTQADNPNLNTLSREQLTNMNSLRGHLTAGTQEDLAKVLKDSIRDRRSEIESFCRNKQQMRLDRLNECLIGPTSEDFSDVENAISIVQNYSQAIDEAAQLKKLRRFCNNFKKENEEQYDSSNIHNQCQKIRAKIDEFDSTGRSTRRRNEVLNEKVVRYYDSEGKITRMYQRTPTSHMFITSAAQAFADFSPTFLQMQEHNQQMDWIQTFSPNNSWVVPPTPDPWTLNMNQSQYIYPGFNMYNSAFNFLN